jgi:hypothetical protein
VFLGAFIKKLLKPKFSQRGQQVLAAIIGLMLFSSCATLDLTLPISELESPQHQGRKTGVGVDFTALTSKQLTLNDDPSKRPVDLITTKHKTGNLFLTKTGLNYYFFERASLSAILIDSKIPAMKLKISILHGFREDAQPGTYHASLNLMGSYQIAESSGNQNGVGGASGFPWKGTANLVSGTVGFSFGYQFFKKAIPFVGVNYQQFQTQGQVNQSAAGADAGGTYKINIEDGKIMTYGLGLDFRPNPRFFIMPQVYMYNFKWYENDYNEVGGSVKLVYVPVQ